MLHGGKRLGVWWDDEPLCEISDDGAARYHSSGIPTPERIEARDSAYQIACTVFGYMRLMGPAPLLKIIDLGLGLRPQGVYHGHSFSESYDHAEQDFADRSNLIPEQQLIAIYRCCADTQDG